jgi:nitroimidazol reductase NimA-like FMN-containing flavoprotein (pyridoxamine 5'-phosphate oxidase superfamily)
MQAPEHKELKYGGLDQLDDAECWRLLASQPVGRFAFIVGHYPVILPVNFKVVARGIIFKTAPGAKLDAIHRSNVSLEADQIDPIRKVGWSVLVRGSAREISARHANPELVELIDLAAPQPWAPGRREHLVRIVVDSISGRRIRLPEPPPGTDPGASL